MALSRRRDGADTIYAIVAGGSAEAGTADDGGEAAAGDGVKATAAEAMTAVAAMQDGPDGAEGGAVTTPSDA